MRVEFIDPGALRRECRLEAPTHMPDDAGGHGLVWTEVGTVFARIEPVSAVNRFGADQTLETVTHRVTLRSRPDIAAGMRLTRGGRILDIVTVHDPDESGRYLTLSARERIE